MVRGSRGRHNYIDGQLQKRSRYYIFRDWANTPDAVLAEAGPRRKVVATAPGQGLDAWQWRQPRESRTVFKNHADHVFGGHTCLDVLIQMGGCPCEFIKEKGPPKNSKTPRNREERRADPPGPPDPCTAFSVYQQHQEPSSEEQQQAQRSSRTTRSWFGTMEYPECHICKMIFNGELQFLDHLKGKRHRKHLKKAHRRQMELKLTVEPDDKAPPPSGLKDNLSPFWPRNPIMDPTTWTGMFPSKVFKIAECGTYMIHRENGWTIKDCRTGQRKRWADKRHAEAMEREKKERREVVARWKERKRMQREDHPA